MDPANYSEPEEFNPSRWDVREPSCIVSAIYVLRNLFTLIRYVFNSAFSNTYLGLIFHLLIFCKQNYRKKGGAFIPFGAGSRSCPGSDLAKLEMSIFLHYFLLNYE